MKKNLWLLLILFLLCCLLPASAQTETRSEEDSILKQFPVPKYTYRFFQKTKKEYFRFPYGVPFFDPLDLKYFPHEKWKETDWALLTRWEDSWTYKQLIMLREPAESWIFHGTSIGPDFGFLDDFYLYATLFVSDSAPADTGSCYVYYSDSLLKGLGINKGILMDPQSGIYRVDNTYELPYNLTNKSHELNIVKALDPKDYPISEEDIESSSFAAHDFIYDLMDRQFASDWRSVQAGYHVPGSSVKAYRIELIREGTNLRVYINGKFAASLDDAITKTDKNGNTVPEMVSWSYGPLLYTGGETVTCSIGALYINGRGKTEEKP